MTNWNTYKVGELYSVASGLSKSRSEFGFGNPFVTFKDVFYNFFIPAELESLANTTEKERTTCSVKRGDIFLTRTSETMHELGMSAVALKDYENATFNGFTKRLRLKDKVSVEIDPIFIGYYFRTTHIRNQIGMHATMTTRASLNSAAINSIEITIPGIEVQKRIGEILKSLDDKIELNRRMNQTLEQMAQTLFREYFVDGIDEENLPEGWKTGSFDDIVTITSGKSMKRDEFAPDGLYEIYGANGVIGRANRFLYDDFLLLTGRVGTLGTIQIVSDKVWVSDNVLISKPLKDELKYFIYFIMKGFDYESMKRGSTQPLITQTDLKNQKVILPNHETLTQFHIIVKSIFEKIYANNVNTNKLTQLRDTLLPKLMAGEIDVMQTQAHEMHEPVLS